VVARGIPCAHNAHDAQFLGSEGFDDAQLQQIMFMKNMSMLGGALLISFRRWSHQSQRSARQKDDGEIAEVQSFALKTR
jgi:hypothetical protein